jgi:hypothetical protein
MKSGCWWETCVKDLDVTAEKKAFVPNDVGKSLDILIRLFDKVYPFGSWLFRNAKTWTGVGPKDCTASFKKWMVDRTPKALTSWNNFLDNLPLTIHETVHCMHSNNGKQVPDLLGKLDEFTLKKCSGGSCTTYTSFTNGFPKRKDINAGIPAEVKSDGLYYNLYFTKEHGNYDVHMMLTETEAYLHDSPASAWMNDGVGKGNSVKPSVDVTRINMGNTYSLAFWSFASVLYIGRIKSHHKGTWQKMKQKGDSKHAVIGRLFLAHHDRFNFLLQLYIDKNGFSDSKRAGLTKLLREEKKKVLAADNFVEELRAALS